MLFSQLPLVDGVYIYVYIYGCLLTKVQELIQDYQL